MKFNLNLVRSRVRLLSITSCLLFTGCAFGPTIGFSLPIGGFGSIGVNIGADGRVGGSLGVGIGGGAVSVGTSVQLPPAKKAEEEETKK